MTSKTFVGFSTLEELAEQLCLEQHVNVIGIVAPGKAGQHGIRVDTNLIIVSQEHEKEIIYCNVILGRFHSSGVDPFPETREGQRKRVNSALPIVTEWLRSRRFRVRNALIAIPEDLRTLDGSADFLRFDKDSGEFKEVWDE